ncbi:hypothetical protein ECANGB1_752 [Enterospora canceri]|uniref:ABC transporter domain-containing protein n=1 Tax=Enterospora canceri TaxID=1081671 RepID=A0A1Y1S7I1_9MICR|nr:hypothetical protein ECANGB1_752 [Enterospora canceri]
MIFNNYDRNTFLLKETSNEPRALYKLPNNYRVILEVELNRRIQRISGSKGEKILIGGTNGVGKTKFFVYLLNDYKSQVFLENLDSEITATIFLTYDEFYSVISYLEQDPLILNGTVLDNLFLPLSEKMRVLEVVAKYDRLNEILSDHIRSNRVFTNNRVDYDTKSAISLLRALYLAENREILLFDDPDEIYLDEIFRVNKDKCILITGHYSKEAESKFNRVVRITAPNSVESSTEDQSGV